MEKTQGFFETLFANWKVVMSLGAIIAFAYAGLIETRIRLANLEDAKSSNIRQWELIREHGNKLEVHGIELKHILDQLERQQIAVDELRRRN